MQITIDSDGIEVYKKALAVAIQDLTELIEPKQQENKDYQTALDKNNTSISAWTTERDGYQANLDDLIAQAAQVPNAPDSPEV